MENYCLLLSPANGDTLELGLSNQHYNFDINNLVSVYERKVYSDKLYNLSIVGDISNIENVVLLINDYEVEGVHYNKNNGTFAFYNRSNQLFRDYFAFAYLSLLFEFNDGTERLFYSDYLNIMIKEGKTTQSIKDMAEYVFQDYAALLFDSSMPSLDITSFAEDKYNTLESQLKKIESVVSVYKECRNYFELNAKFKIVEERYVGPVEKMTFLDYDTISYIVQNPEYLQPTDIQTGIRCNNQEYYPSKTLIGNYEKTFDFYENQIVVGFLNEVRRFTSELSADIANRLNSFNSIPQKESEYQTSAQIVFTMSRNRLSIIYHRLANLLEEIDIVFGCYKNALNVSNVLVESLPPITSTFSTLKYYSKIYEIMKLWFAKGVYNFAKSDFLAPFLINNQLYEYFLLVLFVKYFKSVGFCLDYTDAYKYNPRSNKLFTNTPHNNTFVFVKEQLRITLYYQPVIYDRVTALNNDIDLIRNTELTFDRKREHKGKYYLPDFILKMDDGQNDKYIILDAKFSKKTTISSYYFPELTFKYLFSITEVNDNASLLGLCALSGKDDSTEKIASVYNDSLSNTIIPRADIVNLTTENIDYDSLESVNFDILNRFFEQYNYDL